MVETRGDGKRPGSLRDEGHIASPFEYLMPEASFQHHHDKGETESGGTLRVI